MWRKEILIDCLFWILHSCRSESCNLCHRIHLSISLTAVSISSLTEGMQEFQALPLDQKAELRPTMASPVGETAVLQSMKPAKTRCCSSAWVSCTTAAWLWLLTHSSQCQMLLGILQVHWSIVAYSRHRRVPHQSQMGNCPLTLWSFSAMVSVPPCFRLRYSSARSWPSWAPLFSVKENATLNCSAGKDSSGNTDEFVTMLIDSILVLPSCKIVDKADPSTHGWEDINNMVVILLLCQWVIDCY